MRINAAAIALLVAAGPAQAGFQVEQNIVYGGDSKGEAALSWQIGDRDFRLDVKRGANQRSFIFNGHVFYVCGKLDKARLDYVKRLNLPDRTLLPRLAKGACQELGTSFSLAFLLSPFDAVSHGEVGGGFGGAVGVANANVDLAGTVQAVQGNKCVDFTRAYKLEEKSAKATDAVSETLCNAPAIKWRDAFFREIGMTLMRQAGGRASFQAVAGDLKKMAGLPLSVSGKTAGRSETGKDFSQTYEVTTSAAKAAATAPLGLPAGYEVLDTSNLATMAAHQGAGGKAGASSGIDVSGLLRVLMLDLSPLSGLIPQ